MKQRNPIAVFFLGFIPFYSLYWFVSTKGELVQHGADIPTAWLLIVPFANIWWLYKYSAGIEHVTENKVSTVVAFLLIWLLGSIGQAIIQDSFNKVGGGAPVAASPPAPAVAVAPPDVNAPQPPTSPTVV